MVFQKSKLKKRDLYLNRLIAFQDTDVVKVITGIRRCGKSSLLRLMAQHLRESGVAPEQVIELNFESMALSVMSNRQFYQCLSAFIRAVHLSFGAVCGNQDVSAFFQRVY